jgi:hypothetical protein
VEAKGLCWPHRKQQRQGRPLTPIVPRHSPGTWDGLAYLAPSCEKPIRARWFCKTHAKYDVSPEFLQAIWDRQQGSCAICNVAFSRAVEYHIDHDHECCPDHRACERCVRGFLCELCNLMVGQGRDNPKVFLAAAFYLQGIQ